MCAGVHLRRESEGAVLRFRPPPLEPAQAALSMHKTNLDSAAGIASFRLLLKIILDLRILPRVK
jgi:hypothetical protein